MTRTLITMSAVLAAIGASSIAPATPTGTALQVHTNGTEFEAAVEAFEWRAVDSLKLAWVPIVPVVWQADEDIPVIVDEKFDLAKHMELPVGSVVILPPWMLSQQSPEDPRR